MGRTSHIPNVCSIVCAERTKSIQEGFYLLLKFRELIPSPQDFHSGTMMTRDTSAVGGNITKRLVQIAEQLLVGRSGFEQ